MEWRVIDMKKESKPEKHTRAGWKDDKTTSRPSGQGPKTPAERKEIFKADETKYRA
jgi:hypothetical protein